MALKKKKVVVKKAEGRKIPKITVEDMENFAAEYSRISEQIKQLDSRKKELSTIIKEGANLLGVLDDKGSHYLSTDNFICGSVHSVTLKPNIERGYKFLNEYKCKDGSSLKNCVVQVTTYQIDEEALGSAVQEGKIDIDTVRKEVYDQTDKYSVSVKPRESADEMPEVVQTTFKSTKKAARKK